MNETKDSEMLQILKTKQKEIEMKKRKSYAELESVKKKKKNILFGFGHYYNNVKNKKKDCKGLYSCITCLKKKRKGRARHMSCLLFGQLPNCEKTSLPLRFTEHALLVTPRANMNESSP